MPISESTRRRPGRGTIIGALAFTIIAAAAAQPGDTGLDSIRADALKGHVFFLAAPEMGGRDSLSLEARIAANYIAGFFHRFGLKPAGDGGTYFQNFPMTQAFIDRAQTRLRATVENGENSSTVRDFVLASDFTLARQGGVDLDVTAPLVFAGYGIDAPEYGYNDYAGIDVAGKIVLILSREPQASDPKSRFKGTWDTFHAYPAWKPEVARRHGARGVLIVQGPPDVRRREASGPTNGQIRTDRPNHSLTSPFWDLPVFNIEERVANELLSGIRHDDRRTAGVDRPNREATVDGPQRCRGRRCAAPSASAGRSRPATSLASSRAPTRSSRTSTSSSPATTTTSARKRPSSSTGPTTTQVPARRSSPSRRRSERAGARRGAASCFLVFEAEEDFLQGAFHYVNHPIVPLDRTVAVLNMDMIGRDEESATWNIKADDSRNSVNLIGTLYSPDLRRVIEAQNKAIGLTLDYKTDTDDREDWFTRSDHYPFAIKGVPMVLFNTGEHPDYHTANDTWDRINYPKMERIVRLVYSSARISPITATRPKFVTEHVPSRTSVP